jgi:hypothetical protein
MTRGIGIFAATALAIAVFALAPNSAIAQSYSGNRPMTWNITFGHTGTVTYCLTLTDDGSAGFPHSGPAILNGSGEDNLEGFFQVVSNELVATFYVPGSNESIAGLVFAAPSSKGTIGKGFGEFVSGAYTDMGPLVFGKNGGCENSE